MLKFTLLAIHLANGTPNAYALDTGLTVEDCGEAIAQLQTERLVWLTPNSAVPVHAVKFACELESAK